jgi:CubicO group peptidase (beta-lactamase class C family)
MQFYREEPDLDPGEVGIDAAALDALVDEFRTTLEKGELCGGSQVAVFRRGRCVLSAGGGWARERLQVPVSPESMFVLFSSTKGLAGLAMLMLYERKAFHYDEPVSKYWPEFASVVPEKASITIRHVMCHRGGFPIGPRSLTTEQWGDREAIQRAMEQVRLRFTPGETNAYHPMNYGHVLNELMQRIDGRDCGTFLREEVFAPLGIEDLYLGLPADPALEARVAWCTNDVSGDPDVARATGFGDGSESEATAPPRRSPPERYADIPEMWHEFNWPETYRAVLPASNAIGSARALAEVYSVLAMGGRRGEVDLVSPKGLAYVTTPTNREGEVDGTVGFPMRWGLGFHMGLYGKGGSLRTFGHAGAGGQVGFADPDRELAFAFATTGELAPEFNLWRFRLQSRTFAACLD